MFLKIKCNTHDIQKFYENHTSFHKGDSGLDLFIPEDHIIKPGELSHKINLGISCEALNKNNHVNTVYNLKKSISFENCIQCGQNKYSCMCIPNDNQNISYYLYPRSSIMKTSLRLSNSVGIIDAGYRGNIIAIVDNLDHINDVKIKSGTRLFQLCSPNLSSIQFKLVNELSNTSRNNNGFGSTGN